MARRTVQTIQPYTLLDAVLGATALYGDGLRAFARTAEDLIGRAQRAIRKSPTTIDTAAVLAETRVALDEAAAKVEDLDPVMRDALVADVMLVAAGALAVPA